MKLSGWSCCALALGLAACQTTDEAAWTSPAQGLLVAENSCSDCHGVRRNGVSANPDAPTFADIARRGMNETVLAGWLEDTHNFPAEMGFALQDRQARALAAYIHTLRPEN